MFQTNLEFGQRSDGVSSANIRDLAEASELLSAIAVAEPWSVDLVEDGRAVSLRSWTVSEGFFDAIGAEAEVGRTFTADEYQEGMAPVVILSHATWQTRFGGDPAVVGRALSVDGAPTTVVGVMPATFKFPNTAAAWSPRPAQPWDDSARAADFMAGVGRLAPGVSLAQAQAEMDQLAAGLAESYPETNAGVGVRLVPLREYLFGDVRMPLLVLLGAVGFVLLIACANVAGLQLARGSKRQREYALRGALGATSSRLARLTAVESMLLAVVGCALGVGFAVGGVQVIRLLGPDQLPRIDELAVDGTVLGFAALAAVVSALFSSLAPTLKLSRPDLAKALGEGARGATRGVVGRRLRSQLLVAEVALAVVLLIGAGLLFRSFAVLVENELGFDPENRLALQVFAYGYDDAAAQLDFVRESTEAIEALPGVRGLALTTNLPLATDATISSIDIDVPFTVADRAQPPRGQEPNAWMSSISSRYSEVMGIPLIAGRHFDLSDDGTAPQVVMVNETLVRRHFPDQHPLGESLIVQYGDDRSFGAREIVGILRDVRPLGFESEPRPEVYVPLTQLGSGSLTYVIHTDVDPASLALAAQEAIWNTNPNQAVWAVVPMPDLLADLMRTRRFNLVLLAAFAELALFLAAIGIYGLISFSVEQRVGELGIRRALGGQAADILGMVMREGAVLAGGGIILGVVGAIGLTRLMRGMLYGVDPVDPLTFGTLSAAVMVVAALAVYLPARRAMRVDPMVALRAD